MADLRDATIDLAADVAHDAPDGVDSAADRRDARDANEVRDDGSGDGTRDGADAAIDAQIDGAAPLVCVCAPPSIECDGRCIDPASDRDHCGAAPGCGAPGGSPGRSCVIGTSCAQGRCRACTPLGTPDHRSYAASGQLMATGDLDRDGHPDVLTAGITGLHWLRNDGTGRLQPMQPIGDATDDVESDMAIGDVDEDGVADIVAAEVWRDPYGPDGAFLGTALRLGNGDGSFRPWESIAAVDYDFQILLADVNEDHHLDLIALPERGPAQLAVSFGAGDGTFGPPVTILAAGGPILGYLLTAGDVDGDSHVDLLLGPYNGAITVLFGDGTGNFARAVDSGVTGLANDTVTGALGHLDGDGRLDLALGLRYLGRVSTWRGKGDGTFQHIQDLQGGAQQTFSEVFATAIQDLDGDGRSELLVLRNIDVPTALDVLRVAPDGTLVEGQLPLGGTAAAIAVADFDGDGDLDVVSYSLNGPTLQLQLNRGDGTFVAQAPFDAPGETDILGVVAGDLDGDGIADLLVQGLVSQRVYFGSSDGTFRPAAAALDAGYRVPVALADLDQDGKLDLLSFKTSSGSSPGSLLVALGDGTGTFGPPSLIAAVDSSGGVATFADFDGDCRLDLVWRSDSGADPILLRGKGGGAFEPVTLPSPGALVNGPVIAGDFNGDGRPDLAYGVNLDGAPDGTLGLRVFPGNGDGTFGAAITTAVSDADASLTEILAATGDLDADGIPDLAVVRFQSYDAEVRLFPGDGAGAFRLTGPRFPLSDQFGGMGAGDLNGDGRLDLAILGYTSGQVTTAGTCPGN